MQATLSRYQFATLRWVAFEKVTLADFEGVHGGTLWSLLHASQSHGPLIQKGTANGRSTRIEPTKEGTDLLSTYMNSGYRERLHPTDLTARCASLLRVLNIMKHQAARKAPVSAAS